ncbi:hypothetical protein NVV95_10540 [Herbiconiux sp. CPCC 205716]|uniref:Uncharacterized protein n=1 Tax=Herbiconiux gentiana TaxID=2970912 RepID=A0ABT2GFJ1_9MICO|nr:hypothetical protein [Herbiconiux gentiana]MCS5714988.1 hypothetical protein [Herbiconiux gentiana]
MTGADARAGASAPGETGAQTDVAPVVAAPALTVLALPGASCEGDSCSF